MKAATTPAVISSKGPVRLGERLGRGGEGEVYEVEGEPSLVAKLYLKDISHERAEKLRVMPQLLTPKLAALTAWPHDVLKGRGDRVVGFLMPRISANDIHKVYGPKSRQQIFPQADWRLLVRAALNTARAFAVVHEAGFLVADVNHGGVMVTADATVRLIDCDSFQVTAGAKTFPCEVGVEEFTPPELQGAAFRGLVRTANHDNFGLAVLIFQLLMLGRHPFAGRHRGKGDLSIGEAIAQFKYAYSRDKARTLMEPPPYTAPVLVAGQEIAQLWEQAFAPAGNQPRGRPTAEAWVLALKKLEKSFAKCANHGGHYFAQGIACPWCPIQLGTGASLFPLPAGQAPRAMPGGPFSLEAVWAQIASVQPPPAQPAPAPASGTPASPEAQSIAARRNALRFLSFVTPVGIFLGGIAIGIAWLFCAFAAFIAHVVIASNASSGDTAPYRQRRDTAQSNFSSLADRWAKEASSELFATKRAELQRKVEQHRQLGAKRQLEYETLVKNRASLAKRRYLDRFEIADATVSGIGPAKKSMLESYGIETAADITEAAVMNVPGFGPALTKRLLDWRRGVESKFRFDPASGVDPRDVADLDQRIAQERRDLEDALHKGGADLHHLRASILSRRQALEGALRAAIQALEQAEADLAAVS